MNRNKKEKLLFSCESIVSIDEYKKMAKNVSHNYWAYVFWGTLLNIIATIIIVIVCESLFGAFIFFICFQIYIMILYKVRIEYYAGKSYISFQKKGLFDSKIDLEFYDDYLIRKSESEILKIPYFDIDKCVETETNMYLQYKKKNKIIIIQKEKCSIELIDFIKTKITNIDKKITKKKLIKTGNSTLVKVFMIILFILTLCSIYFAMVSVDFVNEIIPQHGFNFTKNMWVMWCWLPIPIFSIILGFIYNSKGYKCTKNIVGGFIIGFHLFIFGLFCLFPTFEVDYSEIDNYKEIIDLSLPKDGELEIEDWDTYFDEDKTEYTIINAYYDDQDVSSLEKDIKKNNNWLLSTEINSQLKVLLPSQLKSDKDAYFSIYNKTSNEYNIIPNKSGKYEIYAMKYDISDKQLEIHKYILKYK